MGRPMCKSRCRPLYKHRPAQAWLIAVALAGFGIPCSLDGQTPTPLPPPASLPAAPAPPQAASPEAPRPGEVYRDAMRPLDAVRDSLDNWSDAELGALSVGIHKAREACSQGKPEQYAGDDLYDFMRVCALGQDWSSTLAAALAYIASGQETHRAQAYAMSISARVHTNELGFAQLAAMDMLHKLPYDAEVAYAMRYLKTYLEQSGDPAALTLATEEHSSIVAAIAAGVPLKALHGDAAIGLGELYESALDKAFLERYTGDDRAAALTFLDLQTALAKAPAVTAQDRQLIDAITTQYTLLGMPLPAIDVRRSLVSGKARINPDYGAATIFFLFPDWCTQCRKMMKTVTAFATIHAASGIHTYGLIFQDQADARAEVAEPLHEETVKEMRGTATLLVAPETPHLFGATSFPFAVVTDKAGRIQFLGTIPGNAFDAHGFMDMVLARIPGVDDTRPAEKPSPATPAPGAHIR